jgi:type I restriction enzyme, S subunit
MIGDLKPYPSTKESGVPWLGKVPDHWSVLPNRALFAEIKDRNHPNAEMLSVTITKGVVRQKELLADSSKKDSSNLDRSAYKLVQPRDIAYNKMRAWQGAIGASDYRGIISPAYVVMRLRGDANPRYFHHLYRTPQFAKEAERWSYGITSDMWSLRPEHFRLIYSPLPPQQEQDAIVLFVEHVDRQVRSYIRTKKKLIKLLEEQKLGIIQSAMTRGLDLNTKLRPSGVEWIGDVPESWEIKRLKYAVPGVTVGIVIQPAQMYVPSGVPCLRSLNISKGKIDAQEIVYISERSNSTNRKSQLHCGDIVVVRTGKAGVAVVVPPEYEGANCVDLLIIRKSSRILSDYLLTYLNSYAAGKEIEYNSVGAIQAHYNTGTLANLLVAIPPVVEQQSILAFLESSLKPLHFALQSNRREINLLTDLRARLIADVVTGKRDVRDASEKLRQGIQETPTIAETNEVVDEDEGAVVPSTDEAAEEAEA